MTTTRARQGLSVPQGAALTIGAVLGTGVISLPGLAAEVAGPASLVAWLGLVLLSVPLATTFAALGARHPDGGGVSTYARLAFGDRASTMVGWSFYFTIAIGAPVASGFAGAYVADAVGGGGTTALATAAALIGVVAVTNYLGIRVSGTTQLAIAGAIAVLLVAAVAVSLPHADPARLAPFAPHGWTAVGSAAALLVWAFAGWEVVSSLSAEYDDPRRGIGRATAIAVVVVGVLYLGIAAATLLVLGPAPGPAPLSDLLVLGFGEAARPVTAVVAVLMSVGAMNAYFAGAARLGAALARDGSLPTWLARGSSAGETPRRSLGVVTGLALATTAVLWVGGLPTDATMLLTTGTFTLVYVVGAAAAVRLLPRAGWAWRCAVVSLVAALGLLVLTGPQVIGSLVIAASGLAWSTWSGRSRRSARTPAAAPGAGCPAGSSP